MAAPKQRNTRDEKQAIRAGKTAPEVWPDQPAKDRPDRERKAHLDIAIPTFGYKVQTSIDRRDRLIRCWDVTDASRRAGCTWARAPRLER